MAYEAWKALSGLSYFLVFVMIVGGLIAYFYPTTYVTFLGTYYDYPYRGYVLPLAFGVFVFVIVGIGADEMARKETKAVQVITTVTKSGISKIQSRKLFCPNCGREVSHITAYCEACGQKINV
jgi:hypothetical protein